VWGETGINGQHAFYQLLHQGTQLVPADLIVSINNRAGAKGNAHHQQLLANCFAQSQAMMNGVSEAQVVEELQAAGMDAMKIKALAPHKVHPGNRPATTILLDTLDAYHLGALIALYEQKIFVQGIIWQIYSFDQWGVQLGKELATNMQPDLQTDARVNHYESSTNGLINYYKNKGK
jgi:glucose-6-phosphate isomerase